MKLTFPNMGSLSVLVSALMRDLDIPFVTPPESSDKTVELGTRYAPNGACMPMKTILGSFIEAYEAGADIAIFFGGCGPCCFGYFAETFNLIFRKNGINMRVIGLEKDKGGLLDALRIITEGSFKVWKFPRLTKLGMKCAKAYDEYDKAVCECRASVKDKRLKKIFLSEYENIEKGLKNSKGLFDLLGRLRAGTNKIKSLDRDFSPFIKVKIVGDIYTVTDSFSNKNVANVLADRGILSENGVSIYSWLCEKLKKEQAPWQMYADKYLKTHIGGFARQSVGKAVYAAARGYDAVVEVYPLGCMPETVAKGIFSAVSRDYSVPVLTLCVDEMSGTEGYVTRIDAFADMIERKRMI